MKWLVYAACLFAANSAYALDENTKSGWFVGLSAGSATFEAEENDIIEDSDTSASVVGGYRFNRYLAVHGNFASLGEFESETGTSDTFTTSINAFTVGALGILPFANSGIEAYGRAGLGLMRYKQTFDFFDSELENASTGDTLTLSIGMRYTPNAFQRITTFVGYDHYYFETERVYGDDDETMSNSVGVIGLGAQFNF